MSTKTVTIELPGPNMHGETPADAGLVLLYSPDDPPRVPRLWRIADKTAILGREPPPGGLAIPETGVSRIHVRISRKQGAWVLSDLDSRNGTIVNGKYVEQVPLSHHDVIRTGDTILQFVEHNIGQYEGVRGDALPALIGGARMGSIAREAQAVASSNLSVLVVGESGTGKEVVAHGIHQASGRTGKLVAINCAAIPPNLIESELFGYKRGAFTGADRDHIGLIRAAKGGTLLLDEIGDMPLDAQAKLLRLIETHEVMPIGGTTGEKVDVRLICATHRDLSHQVKAGKFRGDLLARINGFCVRLPPLRERKEDIMLLTEHFLAKHGNGTQFGITRAFAACVCHYNWPYNVRELETAIRRALVLVQSPELDVVHLPDTVRAPWVSYGSKASVVPSRSERPSTDTVAITAEVLEELLTRHRGNISAIARELRRDRVQIHRWLKRYALTPDKYRIVETGACAEPPGQSTKERA